MHRLRKLSPSGRRKDDADSSGPPARPDEEFFHLINFVPWKEEAEAFDDVSVLQLIKRKPEVVRAKYALPSGNRGRTTKYPLCQLIALHASFEVIKRASKACPEAFTDYCTFGVTPLHSACSCYAPLDVVKYLAKRGPHMVRETTAHAYTPFHAACAYGAPLDVVRFVLELYPEAVLRRNKLGQTPLESAREGGARGVAEFVAERLDRMRIREGEKGDDQKGGERRLFESSSTQPSTINDDD